MKLLFLYGLPATGKLTVARELASLTGYKLFHNHYTVDLLLSVFEFGSPAFIDLREEIWLSVFSRAAKSDLPGVIFTFAPEATVPHDFVGKVQAMIAEARGEIIFVELTCPITQLKERLDTEHRRKFQKLTSVSLFEELHNAGIFDASHMPVAAISLDTSRYSPNEAAVRIVEACRLVS